MAVAEKEITAPRPRGRPSPYSAEFKSEVCEFASEFGVFKAAAKFHIDSRKVSRFLRVHRQSKLGPGPIRTLTKRLMRSNAFTGLPRHEQKQKLAKELLHYAAEIIDRLRSPDVKTFVTARGETIKVDLERPEARDVKDLLVALGVAVDKSTLLSGEATSRHEVVDVAELEKALNDAILDPVKRRALAVRVLGGSSVPKLPGHKPASEVIIDAPHSRVRVPRTRKQKVTA